MSVGKTLETKHCIHALHMALKRVDDTSKKVIPHSDRGVLHTSNSVIKNL